MIFYLILSIHMLIYVDWYTCLYHVSFDKFWVLLFLIFDILRYIIQMQILFVD